MEMDACKMMDLSFVPLGLSVPACFCGGLGLGYLYFRALRLGADLIVRGGRPLFALGLRLGRLALLGAGFYLAVQAGAWPLMAALGGVLAAKWISLRQAERGQP